MIETLQETLVPLPECELRRCGLRALELSRDLSNVPGRLRDIDRCVFRTFGVQDVPADLVERDYAAALHLLDALADVQSALRHRLFEQFGLRCIVGRTAEPYDEHSSRFVAATARPTGNPALDWYVADTATRGYEWNGTPAVLLPARVDVYRYSEDGPLEEGDEMDEKGDSSTPDEEPDPLERDKEASTPDEEPDWRERDEEASTPGEEPDSLERDEEASTPDEEPDSLERGDRAVPHVHLHLTLPDGTVLEQEVAGAVVRIHIRGSAS